MSPTKKAKDTKTQPFRIGHTELHTADCLDWLGNRAEKSIAAVVTDPPYGLHEYSDKHLAKLRAGKGGVWRKPPSFDGNQRAPLPRFTTMSASDLTSLHEFFTTWATTLFPALLPGGHVILACNPLVSPYISMALNKAGLERRGEIVRLVQTMRGGDRPKNAHEEFDDVSVMARAQWEPWLVYRRPIETRTVADNLRKYKTGGLRRISDAQPFGDVIRSSPTPKKEREIAPHPSLKPQSFLRAVVRASLPLGEGIVLDPFAGAGSTLAAAEALGYQSIGIERDPVYAELARGAIAKLSQLTVPGAENVSAPIPST
jgi:site-specific DNA-methyltransferase (adenine-specific)